MTSCLSCGRQATDACHFPRTRKFSDSTVPMCRECHTRQHSGDEEVIYRLIKRAPGYWQDMGEWTDERSDEWETWLSRRAYVQTH